MNKCQTVKLEFTSDSSNSFNTNTKIYGSHIECGGKAAGKIGDDCFSAKYRFNIDAYTLKICSIHFTDVLRVEKSNTKSQTICGSNTVCDSNNLDNSSCFSIINNTFEQIVYKALYSIFSNGVVTKKSAVILTIRLTNIPTINYLVLYIKIGNHSYRSSSSIYNENTISNTISNISSSKSNSHTKINSSIFTN